MVSIKTFRQLAMAFEEAVEQPHFHKISYRVNKKIFATLDAEKNSAVVKLSEIDQSVFCAFDASIIYPASGLWGKHGWTTIDLTKIKKGMLQDILTTSYCNVAPKNLYKKFK